MKRFSEQLKKKASTISLSAAERRELRERLVAYMEYHPVSRRAEVFESTPTTAPVMDTYRTVSFSFRSLHLRAVAGLCVVCVVVGVPLVAERSLPGDVLYPVKVRFNEEVLSTLTFSPYEKIEWETERLGRRIAEARLLESEGKLTEEFEVEVAEAVKAHSDAAQREIETLRATDAEEAALAEITFSSVLDVQSMVLKSRDRGASSTIDVIAGAVEKERTEAAAAQGQSETTPSIERLLARIEQETTRAYELLETVKSYAREQENIDIERRLADIERKIASALTLRQEADTDEQAVRGLLREALQATQKLIVFMTDIDVRETIVVEDLVPVELTEAERTAVLETMLNEIQEQRTEFETAVPEVENDDVRAKIVASLNELNTQFAGAEQALEQSDLVAAEVATTEAYNLYQDIISMLQLHAGFIPVDPEFTTEPPTASSTNQVVVETATSSATTTLVGDEEASGIEQGTTSPERQSESGEDQAEE